MTTRPTAGKASSSGPRPPTSLADYVYQELLQDIQSHQLLPGSAIVQDEVALRLGVSITPVREALRRLESAGHINYAPRVGATVAQLSNEAIGELYELRSVVEGLAARLAARRVTPQAIADLRAMHAAMVKMWEKGSTAELAQSSRDFHSMIAEIGGPAYLAKHLALIWEKATIPPTHSIWAHRTPAKHSLDEHSQLIDLLEAGASSDAEALMTAHIMEAIDWRDNRSAMSGDAVAR